jgi:glycerol transport system ATP-binding protein
VSLVLQSLGLRRGADAVIADISLTLERGTMNVLLGPTLAGKTTLMRLMAGLDQPSSGRLLLDGKDITGVPVRRRSVAMVYQQFVNYPTLSVYENIASPLRVAGVGKAEIDARVQQAARLLRLETMLQRTPLQLSGGQQQRTAIARALVKRADLVLLDEPLANLDYKLREELREELPRIFAESGAILVYATTEPLEALMLGGRTASLWEGRMSQAGPTLEVYRRPETLEAARVFSDPPLNELSVDKSGATVLLPGGRAIPAVGPLLGLPDGRYRIGFRTDDVTVGGSGNGAMSFPGTVAVTELNGSESFVHVDVGMATWVCLVRGLHDLEPGSVTEVHIDSRRIFIFDVAGRVTALPAIAESA